MLQDERVVVAALAARRTGLLASAYWSTRSKKCLNLRAADLPATADQDVIRTVFVYKPADVSLVGASHVLNDMSGAGQDFSIAREPPAQGSKAAGAPDSEAFLVVANHLKSKGNDAAGPYPGDDKVAAGTADATVTVS